MTRAGTFPCGVGLCVFATSGQKDNRNSAERGKCRESSQSHQERDGRGRAGQGEAEAQPAPPAHLQVPRRLRRRPGQPLPH